MADTPKAVTVRDLMQRLALMPPDAELCTYKLGNWPAVTALEVKSFGDHLVECNLIAHED